MIAAVLMAYGTPRSRAEILPYYTDIRRGRPPSAEQLAALTARYDTIAAAIGGAAGGLSPLAARTEAQRDAVQAALDALAPGGYDVLLGMKHAAPTIEDAVDVAASRGAERIVGLVLAPHHSELSVGDYLARLRAAAAGHGLPVAAVESWATEPALVEFLARDLERRLAVLPVDTHVAFTAHSLPERILATGDPYPAELEATATAVAARAGLPGDRWSIAWQSAGRTPEPWLGPDILTVIDRLADAGAPGVVVCACGFVSDHLEVLYDLDVEAAGRAAARGLPFARTACVNADPTVMSALAHRIHAQREAPMSRVQR